MRTPSRLRLALILGSLAALGPMSIDMYLPALPRLVEGFRTGEGEVQLTLTACLAGLGLGQLLVGPLSDSFGRRRPLIVGLVVYVLSCVCCALAPSVGLLTVGRLVQGFAGAAGVVISRAVVRDLYSGTALARFFSMLMLVNGMAPILAPVIGSQLLRVLPWQGVFVLLAAYGLLVALGAGGIMALGQLSGRLVHRVSPRRLLLTGLLLAVTGGVALVATTVADQALPVVLPGLFVIVSSVGLVMPNATALAMAGHPDQAGSASALLGVLQFALGAAAAPLVGAAGTATAVPMAVLMCVLTMAALLAFALLTRPPSADPTVAGPGGTGGSPAGR